MRASEIRKVPGGRPGFRSMSAQLMRATWHGVVVAESDDTVVVEGNHYFPRQSLREDLFVESDHRSVCPWKGQARYLSLVIDGRENRDAAWYYPRPQRAAAQIAGRVAFWKGVRVARAASAATRRP